MGVNDVRAVMSDEASVRRTFMAGAPSTTQPNFFALQDAAPLISSHVVALPL